VYAQRDATEIIRRLALALKKPRGNIPRARSKQRGIFYCRGEFPRPAPFLRPLPIVDLNWAIFNECLSVTELSLTGCCESDAIKVPTTQSICGENVNKRDTNANVNKWDMCIWHEKWVYTLFLMDATSQKTASNSSTIVLKMNFMIQLNSKYCNHM